MMTLAPPFEHLLGRGSRYTMIFRDQFFFMILIYFLRSLSFLQVFYCLMMFAGSVSFLCLVCAFLISEYTQWKGY